MCKRQHVFEMNLSHTYTWCGYDGKLVDKTGQLNISNVFIKF